MKKITFLFIMTLLPLVTNAGILIGEINYDLDNRTKQATVIYHSNYAYYYYDILWIPRTVDYNGETYGVTAIGKGAFRNCYGLKKVATNNNVTTIGDQAFFNCYGLKEVAIGNNVTTIGDQAFYGCGLTSVDIPNSVTKIGDEAFRYCGLTSVTIPNSVTTIGDWAFGSTECLTSVTIGNSVTKIGEMAFGECSNLTKVLLNSNAIASDSSSDYKNIDVFGPQVKEYIIGEDVTSIGSNAFQGCLGMNSITIGNSVTSIENWAFYGCSDLTSAIIGNSVTTIGEEAFGGCPNLTRVLLNSNAIASGSNDYKNIDVFGPQVKEYILGEDVTSIGDMAFYGCSGLTSVDIPNSVTTIGGEAFRECGLTSVTIPNSVTTIGDGAFEECGLTSVTIPNSVTSIGDWAFYDCRGLTSVTIGNSVTKIGNKAFSRCTDLTSVTIGNSVTTIGEKAFEGCPNLTRVLLNSNAVASKSYSDSSTLSNVFGPQVKEYIIGEDVTSIGDRAFYGCSGLTSVDIPNSVTSIGDWAFSYCILDRLIALPHIPPYLFNDSFSHYSAHLIVPKGCKEAYQQAQGWSQFEYINTAGKYKLTYVVDGEEFKPYEIEEGTSITLEPDPVKEGYTFSGWSEIPETMPTHDVTVTGAFTINKYKLTYTVDGVEYKFNELEYGATITPEQAPTRDGYTFSGWSEIPSTMPAHDVTVMGTFAINKYKLTYMVDGEVYKAYELEDGATITPEQAPTKDGYTFSGWSEIPATMPAHDVEITGTFTKAITGTNYLQNVESGLFMTAANDWGTRASVDETGLTIVIEGNEENGYTLDTRVYDLYAHRYLNVTEDDKIYCDKLACNWFFKKVSNGIYALTKDYRKYIAYDGSSSVLTLSGNANDPKAQWRIVTEEMRKEELSKATEAAPLNATFLLPDANFSRFNRQGNWQDNPKKDGENTNMNGAKSDTSFDVYQEITGVPNGFYVVKMQGFYREGTDNEVVEMYQNGTEHLYAKFYVNEESMPVMSVFDEAGKNGTVGKSTQWGYIPNSQSHASSYFDRGLYEHELKVAVENGTLRIGVRKQTAVNGDWTCFDNFRLIYYGTNAPSVGIEQIAGEKGTTDKAPQSIYDLSGRLLQNLQRGVNILRMNDGTTRKVLKK